MHVGMSTFFQNLAGGYTDQEVYAHEIAMADMAEPLGFDSIWAAEHHFDEYTMCPNVAQFLTYMAGRTNRVGLGSMVMVLPWHDPVRLAEEVLVLDHVSKGRAILGVGRGLGRIEFEGFRINMGESRERFVEYAEAILNAFETGYIEANGKFYKQPRTAIRPFPFQSFRGFAGVGAHHGAARHWHSDHRSEALGNDGRRTQQLPGNLQGDKQYRGAQADHRQFHRLS
jgi:alkanesulfonate monooxygenase SsuD/methylene tetrahydromethanopterin reductase-like flavin-dependent oxidoreductase (luciferase family)